MLPTLWVGKGQGVRVIPGIQRERKTERGGRQEAAEGKRRMAPTAWDPVEKS